MVPAVREPVRVATHRDEGGRRLIDGRDLAAFSVDIARIGDGEDGIPTPR